MDLSATYRVIINYKHHEIVHKINATSRSVWSDFFYQGRGIIGGITKDTRENSVKVKCSCLRMMMASSN